MTFPCFKRGARINLGMKSLRIETLDENFYRTFIGGKGLGALLIFNNIPPGTDPLSPENGIVLLTGPLSGSGFPGSSRATLVTKSPLTGTFLDSSIGGGLGVALKRTGFDYLFIEGKAESPIWLTVDNGKVEFNDACDLWGLSTSRVEASIRKKIGDAKAVVLTIGPAGEKGVLFASTACGGRMFGRGGSGAVMGSKMLKAVAITGSITLPWFKVASFADQVKRARKAIMAHPLTRRSGAFPRFGTTFTTEVTQNTGVLPTHNWQEGVFEGAEKVFSDTFYQRKVKSRGCIHCPIGCATIVRRRGAEQQPPVRRPEYETVYAFGSNCGIDDPDTIIEANLLCEEYGLDTISCGVVISFLMECCEKGILDGGSFPCVRFGDREGLLYVIRLIGEGKDAGKLLGKGVKRLSREIGPETERFAMCVKGLELPGYDPRGMKAMALFYATSDRGGCHVRGSSLRTELLGLPTPMDRFSYDHKARFVAELQRLFALMNSYSECLFAGFALTVDDYAAALSSVSGDPVTTQDLLSAGKRIWDLTRLINYREGFTREDDTLPGRLFEDPLPNGPAKGQVVNRRLFEQMIDEYYEAQGWDQTGRPSIDVNRYLVGR